MPSLILILVLISVNPLPGPFSSTSIPNQSINPGQVSCAILIVRPDASRNMSRSSTVGLPTALCYEAGIEKLRIELSIRY